MSYTIQDGTASIKTLKKAILAKEGIPGKAYYITANGNVLKDSARISSTADNSPYFMTMNIPLLGGAPRSHETNSMNIHLLGGAPGDQINNSNPYQCHWAKRQASHPCLGKTESELPCRDNTRHDQIG